MFIDTPGIDDAIITDVLNPDPVKRFSGFENDAMVRELRGISSVVEKETEPSARGAQRYNIFPDNLATLVQDNLVGIEAVLIVTTTDLGALRVARALRYMYYRLLQRTKDASGMNQGQARQFHIFFLVNQGDLQRPQLMNWTSDELTDSTATDERELMCRQIFAFEVEEREEDFPALKKCVTKLEPVNALRETGIRKALDDIAAHFHKFVAPPTIAPPPNSNSSTNTESREECGSCTIV